jgi:hypothetical protein
MNVHDWQVREECDKAETNGRRPRTSAVVRVESLIGRACKLAAIEVSRMIAKGDVDSLFPQCAFFARAVPAAMTPYGLVA